MSSKKKKIRVITDIFILIIFCIVFLLPFMFILLNAAKTRQEAALLKFSWPPENFQLFRNLKEVMLFGDSKMVLALWNSTVITVFAVVLIVIFSAACRIRTTAQRRQAFFSSKRIYAGRSYYSAGCGSDGLFFYNG